MSRSTMLTARAEQRRSRVDRVVGADGRSSVVRRALGINDDATANRVHRPASSCMTSSSPTRAMGT
jgi:2-polyprenyl-6-methoxyphenol hydroxylase-like FAD-dependent oxidoreductase